MLMRAIFVVVGFAVFAAGVYALSDAIQFRLVAQPAVGEVVGYNLQGCDGDLCYAPVLRYQDAEGRTRRFIDPSSSTWKEFSPGERLDILYDPADPERARIDRFFSIWGGAFLACTIGLAFVVLPPFFGGRAETLSEMFLFRGDDGD